MSTPTNVKPLKVCIVGAGPAGLYLAHLLLKQDENVKIDVLEKAPRNGTPDGNAFGFGVGSRHEKFLQEIPGLWHRIEAQSAPVTRMRIIGRNNLCQEMLVKLEEVDTKKRCCVSYETSCESIDADQRVVTTTNGKKINYDLLVGSDGVNSTVRKLLVETKGLTEERYLRNKFWKSLKIPKQAPNVLSPRDFKLLTHPSFKGVVFPRFPEGQTALVFWNDSCPQNPKGIETIGDLTRAMTQAIQPKASKWDIAANVLFSGFGQNKASNTGEIRVEFDDDECKRFVESKTRRENYIKLDRYHDTASRIALVGDAAHGMYSLLGQGAACGFLTASILAKSIQKAGGDIPTALENYSAVAVPEGHAIADLNLLPHAIFGSLVAKLLSVPLLLLNALRGKLLLKRVVSDDVTYQQIYRENSLLVMVCRYFWKKDRVPFFDTKTKLA
eukprot:CAMPEP_0194425626 /NCGR_PEP_ID=MMETSP0176-20130528/24860_1 /TAXON_ID=216777 /ORGANISM="Proboscia alata, Strain PI-D3" /LENGTH=441 /DNA_ID=CAMNT_0039235997 /DNA_START=137 /DNA_END=1462 /DNA_ORIENTATION=+